MKYYWASMNCKHRAHDFRYMLHQGKAHQGKGKFGSFMYLTNKERLACLSGRLDAFRPPWDPLTGNQNICLYNEPLSDDQREYTSQPNVDFALGSDLGPPLAGFRRREKFSAAALLSGNCW